MLNITEIKEAIQSGSIKIFYSFEKHAEDTIEFHTDEIPFSDYSKADELLCSERLKLTLGPIIKSHQNKSFSLKKRFKNDSKCIDIRKNQNRYFLKPKESITILTNERISLDGNYAAVIIPKVSLSDVGIDLTPAYIDPYYDGLLRLLITNTTEKVFEIKCLDSIAQCYFFKLNSIIPAEFKEEFPRKSVFFGQNWKRILIDDGFPFPTRKNSVMNFKFGEIVRTKFENIWRLLHQNALVTSTVIIIATALISYGKIKNDFLNFSEKGKIVDSNKKALDSLATDFKEINKYFSILKSDLRLKKSEIEIEKGSKSGTKKITTPFPKEDIVAILIPNQKINYTVTSGSSLDESNIEFKLILDAILKEKEVISFEYAIIREIES
ncbi:hypothetical protein CR161_06980 [Prosthecochloris sp. ZM]|uniref:dCTP deaminase domain-containing protein n=1 Tax=Prosthecochloris sp. ZM TaxID=2283143 RepID=UPI000DF723E7|nr:hypothetical protein [Prosthecochloris sp. ZM]RDD30475.1 hypothetical protein CR161_06980 [Prosthecochloris sp. ZM]